MKASASLELSRDLDSLGWTDREFSSLGTIPTGGDMSRLPFLLASYGFLCGLAVSLGFEGLLAANINLDLLVLGFGFLGQADLQQALVIVGADLARIHRTWQCAGAGGGSVLPLDASADRLVFF